MMPSLDHCVNRPTEMTALSNSLEVFDTYKHREDKDSDEESFHLPLDDEESESKYQNGNGNETEDDILNKYDSVTAAHDLIDAQLEDRLLNDEEENEKTNCTVNGKKSSLYKGATLASHENVNSKGSSKTGTTYKSKQVITTQKEADVNINISDSEGESCAMNSKKKIELGTIGRENDEVQIQLSEPLPNALVNEVLNEDKSNSSYNKVDKEDKCENSNESSKQNDDLEDLFDISVIKDAEEDNEDIAYNENNSEENDDSEDGNQEKGDEEVSEKVNDIDEEDEQDQLKNDDVDIEESNLGLEVDVGKDGSDMENEGVDKTSIVPTSDNKDVFMNSNNVSKSTSGSSAIEQKSVEHLIISDSERTVNKNKSGCVTGMETEVDYEWADSDKRKCVKRQLSGESEDDTAPKKTRTDQSEQVVEISDVEQDKPPLKTLLTLSDFMKSKKRQRRLTMHDLEEFCLQKICEVLVHKSDLGDVHHQLRMQDQLIETMRKEIQQLTKQARDLEIVNRKLMNDLKQQNATQKPLNPLKITRSVGLQVKFADVLGGNIKRRPQTPMSTTSKAIVQTVSSPVNRGARNITNTTPGKQVQVSNTHNKQQQSTQLPKPLTGPLLSQALQTRNSQTKTNTQTTPRTPPAKSGASSSFIDLTDEDDKKDKAKSSPNKNLPSKNTATVRSTPGRVNTSGAIRLNNPPGKTTPVSSVVASSTPQVMYVVQSPTNALNSSLGNKTVVGYFQSANGVLSSSINGSAVSVIPKQTNTAPAKSLQPVRTTMPPKATRPATKHPAPLPPPPFIRVTLDKPLKPIPPKPHLTIRKTDTGIILQWKMPYELDMYEVIASYQLYAYQETSAPPTTEMWRKVGDVKALALPMACTLTQFADKNKYYFAVRPVDIHKRIGVFSEPEEISL